MEGIKAIMMVTICACWARGSIKGAQDESEDFIIEKSGTHAVNYRVAVT